MQFELFRRPGKRGAERVRVERETALTGIDDFAFQLLAFFRVPRGELHGKLFADEFALALQRPGVGRNLHAIKLDLWLAMTARPPADAMRWFEIHGGIDSLVKQRPSPSEI